MNKELKKSYVTRSVYQKLAEENKRLLHDIYVLVDQKFMLEFERFEVIKKWREKYASDKLLTDMLKEIAIEHFKNKPRQ